MIRRIVDFFYIHVKGAMQLAIKKGMTVGCGCTEMSGVNYGSEPYLITIGDNVRISNNVLFVTHDGGSWVIRRAGGAFPGTVNFGRIIVGNNVFIGARSIILPNVRIGNNVVIGAGAIVTKDVSDNCVVAGVPAKFVCSINEYGLRMKKKMPENWDNNELEKDKKKYLMKVYLEE